MSELKKLNEETNEIVRGLKDLDAVVAKRGTPYTEEEIKRVEQDKAQVLDNKDKIATIRRSQEILALEYEEESDPPVNKTIARHKDYAHKENLAFRGMGLFKADREDLITNNMRQAAYDLGVNFSRPTFTIKRDQTVGTDSAGGYLGTPSLYQGLETYMHWYGGITEVCRQWTTPDGRERFFGVWDDLDGTNGPTIGQDLDPELEGPVSDPLEFGVLRSAVKKNGDAVFTISVESLEDLEEDISALVGEAIGKRISRSVNQDSVDLDATNNKGFITEATSTSFTTASSSAITAPELIRLKTAVDYAYSRQPDCYYYMNQATLGYLKGLTTTLGTPLLMQDWARGGLTTFDNTPILVCSAMADIGAGAYPVAFGPASQFLYRKVRDIRIKFLDQVFYADDAVGYMGTLRYGFRLLNPKAIYKLHMHA